MRLTAGTVLDGLMGPPDAQGRPTINTSPGLFALLTRGLGDLPSGTPVVLTVQDSADTLSVTIRSTAMPAPRPAELLFLGATPQPPAPAITRQVFAGTLHPATGQPAQSLTLHLLSDRSGLPATVTARMAQADGTMQLRLTTAQGTVILPDAPASLAVGDQLSLDILARTPIRPMAPAPAPLPSLAGAPPVVVQLASGRTALNDLERLLPGGAQGLAPLLPGFGQKEGQAAAVALFAAALKGRDFKGWLGDERRTQVEREAGPAPLLRAGAEFTEMARAAAEATAQGWRPVPMPFFDGRQVVPVMIFIRPPENPVTDEDGGTEARPRRSGARFMVDVTLSELGPLQIDGFLQDGRLDTVLRTRRQLDADFRQALEARYRAVVEEMGMAGSLNFQLRDPGPGNLVIGPPPQTPPGQISVTA